MQAAKCLEHNKGKINYLIGSAWKARERTVGSVFGIKVPKDYDLDDSGDAQFSSIRLRCAISYQMEDDEQKQ